MIARTLLGWLRRCGVDRYTVMTWESRLLARHRQALLEVAVILLFALLVLAAW